VGGVGEVVVSVGGEIQVDIEDIEDGETQRSRAAEQGGSFLGHLRVAVPVQHHKVEEEKEDVGN
jgi:hypothetical protein